MKRLKKFLKISFIAFFVLFTVLYTLFYVYTSPKSDKEVLTSYKKLGVAIDLSHHQYKGFRYRKIEVKKDTALPTLVFVHGTIGSVMDFKSYFADMLITQKANLIAYDRIGYNYKDQNSVQESIAFEKDMLEDLIKNIPAHKLILVGYSYGGPIVLASTKKIGKTILIAPAVYSKVEPMPFLLRFYKWRLTRWLVPPIWQEASKEKLSHPKDLQNFENQWMLNPNKIISIHGDSDWVVPYSNSQYLVSLFPKEQLKLITLPKANHDLVWSRFTEIRNMLLKQID